jgi:hypothetical protein
VFVVSANAVRLAWERLKRRAAVSGLRFHDLRHEAVSSFLERGLNMPEVAAISGHRDPRMLMRYTASQGRGDSGQALTSLVGYEPVPGEAEVRLTRSHLGGAGAFRTSAEYSKIAQMIDDNTPEIESSPLCESVTRDGITVRVEIYRLAGRGEGWSLEVVDQKGGSTVWDGTFANDQDAQAEFYRTLESEGIRSIAEPPSGRAH